MNNYIDKQIIKHGNGVVDRPFTLANADEMDATYSSATTGGIVRYPAGVIRFADQYGFKPSEVYNAQRAANNAATGERKPLLAPSPANVAIDSASPSLGSCLCLMRSISQRGQQRFVFTRYVLAAERL